MYELLGFLVLLLNINNFHKVRSIYDKLNHSNKVENDRQKNELSNY